MPKIYAILICLLLLPGCQALAPAQDKVVRTIVKGVNGYCDETSPSYRATTRDDANAQLAPRSIIVDCSD